MKVINSEFDSHVWVSVAETSALVKYIGGIRKRVSYRAHPLTSVSLAVAWCVLMRDPASSGNRVGAYLETCSTPGININLV